MQIRICPTGEHGRYETKFCPLCGRKVVEMELEPLDPPQESITVRITLENGHLADPAYAQCPVCNQRFRMFLARIPAAFYCPGCGARISGWRVQE